MSDKKETFMERDITCPFCGYKDSESWEHQMEDGDCREMECGSCEKKFMATCHIRVTYSTKEPENAKKD